MHTYVWEGRSAYIYIEILVIIDIRVGNRLITHVIPETRNSNFTL